MQKRRPVALKFSYSEFASRVNIRVTSRKVALKRDMAIAMTKRVLCNGVTVSDIKSMNGLAVNTLPNSLYQGMGPESSTIRRDVSTDNLTLQ